MTAERDADDPSCANCRVAHGVLVCVKDGDPRAWVTFSEHYQAVGRLEVLARWMSEALLVLETLKDEDSEDGGAAMRLLYERGARLVHAVLTPNVRATRSDMQPKKVRR